MTEVYEAEQKLKTIDEAIKEVKSEIDDIENYESSIEKPLLTEFKTDVSDLNIYENKYKAQVKIWEKKRRENDLLSGKLKGDEAIKAQREIGLDNIKEVDNHGKIIDSIAENIKGANLNLENINNNLQDQGEQMNRIQDKNIHIDYEFKQVNKIMPKIEGKAKCIQILTFCSVFFMGIADIGLIIALILIKFVFQNN